MKRILGKNIVGQTFGNLIVLQELDRNAKERVFLCELPDGRTKVLQSSALVRRVSGSKSHKPLYKVWTQMKARCSNSKNRSYKDYGGRGICVCDEWMSYDVFEKWALSSGYEKGLSIDRIDNNGNYEPTNCRWATRLVQQNNTRKNLAITVNGETHNVREWSRITGVNSSSISQRYHSGLSGENIISRRRKGWKGDITRETIRDCLSRGMSRKEIASELGVCIGTVHIHATAIKKREGER